MTTSNTLHDTRLEQLKTWLQHQFDTFDTLTKLNGDASFRQYYRLTIGEQCYIVMDALPTHEDCTQYLAVATCLHQAQVCVPDILAQDLEQGFLLLTDFGDTLLLDCLTPNNVTQWYNIAINTLLQMQSSQHQHHYKWTSFSVEDYQRELSLFTTWYLQQLRQITLSRAEQNNLDTAFQYLIEAALTQPQVWTHRDYHSRNLMVIDQETLGILDFQDALWGPVTYDAVSLLRDCYIDWDPAQVKAWALHYHQLSLTAGTIQTENPQQFLRWFDWVGLQRHLKCLGIFSRLYLRDHKPSYLQYIPRVLDYTINICRHYPELTKMEQLLSKLLS